MSDATLAALADTPQDAIPPRPVHLGAGRSKIVPLAWPIEYHGKVYDHVTVRRMTTSEVAAYVDAARLDPKTPLPMLDVPQAVIDELDDDDAVEVNKVVDDFLPRRWRENAAPDQARGDTTRP